ncbi:Smt3-specific protease [Xylographa opegraphella]|nr:Smt3-specific protease [Xylographa opegraphella]
MDQASDPMEWDQARQFPPAFTPLPAAPEPLSELRVIGENLPKKTKRYAAFPYNKFRRQTTTKYGQRVNTPYPQRGNISKYQRDSTTYSQLGATTYGSTSYASASNIGHGHGNTGFGAVRRTNLSSQTLQANFGRKYISTTQGGRLGDTGSFQSALFTSAASPFRVSTGRAANRESWQLDGSRRFIRNAPKRDKIWEEPYRPNPNVPKTPEANWRTAGEQVWLNTKVSPLKRSHETFAGDDNFDTQGNLLRGTVPGAFPADTPPSSLQRAAGQSYEPTFLESMQRFMPRPPVQPGNATRLSYHSTTSRPTPQRTSDGLFAHIISPSTLYTPTELQHPITMTDKVHNIAAACLSTLGSVYTVAVQSVGTARTAWRFGKNVAYGNKRHILSASRATMDVTVHTYRAAVQGAGSFKRRLIEFTVSAQQPLRPSPSGVSSARQPRNTTRHTQHSPRATATESVEVPVANGSDGRARGSGNAVNDVPRTPPSSPRYVESTTPPNYHPPSPFYVATTTPPNYHPPSPFLTSEERYGPCDQMPPKADANFGVSKLDLLLKLSNYPVSMTHLKKTVPPASWANYRKDLRKIQKRPSKGPSAIAQYAAEAYLKNKVDDSELYSPPISPISPRLPLAELESNASSVISSPIVPARKAVHFYTSPNTGKPVNDVRYVEEDSTADTTFDFSSDLSSACSEDGSLDFEEHTEVVSGSHTIHEDESQDNSAVLEVPGFENSDDNVATVKSLHEYEAQFAEPLNLDDDESQDNGAVLEEPGFQNSDDNPATVKGLDEYEAQFSGPLDSDKDESQDDGGASEVPITLESDDTSATTMIVTLNNEKEAEGAMSEKSDGASTSPISKVKNEGKEAEGAMSEKSVGASTSPISKVKNEEKEAEGAMSEKSDGASTSPISKVKDEEKKAGSPLVGISKRRVSQRTRDALEAKRREEEAKRLEEEAKRRGEEAKRCEAEDATIAAQLAREQKAAHVRMEKSQAELKAKQERDKAGRMTQDDHEAWLTKMHRKAVPVGTTLLQPLSAEWQLKLTNAMNRVPAARLATTSNGTELLRKDFGTVLPQGPPDEPSAWLNDNIIDAYLQLGVDTAHRRVKLKRGIPRYHAFTPFFFKNLASKGYPGVARWAKKAKIGGKDLLKVEYVIVPINPLNHWTVMVISPLHKTIEYFDSLSSSEGTSNRMIELGMVWLRGELGSKLVQGEWTTKVVAGPRQENSSDCGVFAVTTARMILFGWDPKGAYHADHIPEQRRRMLAELMKGRLEEEFAPVWAWDGE